MGLTVTYPILISFRVIDSKGRNVKSDALLEITLRTKGKGGAAKWAKDGTSKAKASAFELSVKMPGRFTKQRGTFLLKESRSKVTQCKALDYFRGVSVKAVPSVSRLFRGKGRSRAALRRALASSGELSGKLPRFRLKCVLPRLSKGQKYVLKLGGGGGVR